MGERLEDIIKSMLINKINKLEYIIKSDIAFGLPELNSKTDINLFNEIIDKSNNLINHEKLRYFYDSIKKKYANFLELAYLNANILFECYNVKNLIQSILKENIFYEKYYFIDLLINNSILNNNNIKQLNLRKEYYELLIYKHFNLIDEVKIEDILTDDSKISDFNTYSFCCIKIDKSFILNKNNIKNVYMYDKSLQHKSLCIEVNYLYDKLYYDIYYILSNRNTINHLILNIKSNYCFNIIDTDENNYTNENKINSKNNLSEINQIEYEFIMNDIIYIFLKAIEENNLHYLHSLTIIGCNNINFELNNENCKLLSSITNSLKFKGLVLKNIFFKKIDFELLLNQFKYCKAFILNNSINDYMADKLITPDIYNNNNNNYTKFIKEKFNTLKNKYKILIINDLFHIE